MALRIDYIWNDHEHDILLVWKANQRAPPCSNGNPKTMATS